MLFRKTLNKLGGHCFIILSNQAILNQESVEVKMFCVGSCTKSISNGCLTRSLWTKNANSLWDDCSFGLGINRGNITCGIYMFDLTKHLVVVDNWERLVKVILNSCLDGLSIVVGSTTSFSSLHASCEHNFLWNIVEKDLRCLDDFLFKVNGLIKSSWKSIDQIILKIQI